MPLILVDYTEYVTLRYTTMHTTSKSCLHPFSKPVILFRVASELQPILADFRQKSNCHDPVLFGLFCQSPARGWAFPHESHLFLNLALLLLSFRNHATLTIGCRFIKPCSRLRPQVLHISRHSLYFCLIAFA